MKHSWFNITERQKALLNALKAREGTPFVEGMSTSGVGYDCAHFVRDCYKEVGIDVSYFDNYPQISLNYGKFHSESVLLKWLNEAVKTGNLISIGPHYEDDDISFECGDLIAVQQFQCANHLAILQNDEFFWHVPRGGCVSQLPLSMFNLKSWKQGKINIPARYRIPE